MEIEGKVSDIEQKVQQLIKLYAGAQKEIQRLQKENDKLSEQLHLQIENSGQWQQKADTLQLTSGKMEAGDKKDLEKRINIYLKDIDKCLALLQAQ